MTVTVTVLVPAQTANNSQSTVYTATGVTAIIDKFTATNYSGQETSIMWALTSTATQDFAVLIETGSQPPGPDIPEPVTMFGLLAGIGCLTHYARKRGGRASVR